MDPPEGWNNVDDCIGFPCTAPHNVLFIFENTKFSGKVRPSVRDSDWQIVPDLEGVSDTYENCEFKEQWNAWLCENDNLGQLFFIGDDQTGRIVTSLQFG